MSDKRNVLIDVIRVIAAVGILLSHVDLSMYGSVGALLGQFLSVRFSLMFFLAIIGFYLEKSYQAGKNVTFRRVCSLTRVYAAWTLIYLALSFVLLVLIQKMPLGDYLLSRVKGFFFTGSYYHFWFYPAVIYAILFIGLIKKALRDGAMRLLVPLASVLYIIGLLGTGYLPLGRQIIGLSALYVMKDFEAFMHLALLGFPSVVFGMVAAKDTGKQSGKMLAAFSVLYVVESVVLCIVLGWRDDPPMLLTTPFLTVLFIRWIQNKDFSIQKTDPVFLRTLSAGIYNVHPLILAGLAIMMPTMNGMGQFLICTVFSAVFGCVHYRLRKIRFFAYFL